jgi:hypothetical protein
MKKLLLFVALVFAGSACNKPSEDDCRKAIEKIRELTGTDKIEGTEDVETAVRSCRGSATKESVKCAMEASSLEQLERCGLMKKEDIEALEGIDTGSGSGTASGTGQK